jgi:chaperonin GroEL
MRNNTQEYNTSRDRLIKGIKTVYDIIAPTYGPNGGNVAMETELSPHGIYNDGKKIADMIFLEDPVEQMGANIMKEACDKQEKECGDGRKTTVILTHAILDGVKETDSPLKVKRELDEAVKKVLGKIDEVKQEIDIKDIGKVAEIAGESKEIGDLIGEIYPQIGREGIIEVETSNLPQTFYEIVDGIRLHGAKKLLDIVPYQSTSVVEDAKVLIIKDKIMSKGQLIEIYKKITAKKIVLYCDEIEQSVLMSLANTNLGVLNGEDKIATLVVKSPVMFKDWLYEDLEKMTGAVAISAKAPASKFDESWLGNVKIWKAEKDESRLNGTLDISEHIKTLEENQDENMKVRLGWLNTKVAILKVGANSESELSWKIRKTIDASNASKLALKDGVVEGGGMCLFKIASGNETLDNALVVPASIIGVTSDVFDPAIVVKSALTTAVSLAGIILTIKGALVVPQYYKDLAREMSKQR